MRTGEKELVWLRGDAAGHFLSLGNVTFSPSFSLLPGALITKVKTFGINKCAVHLHLELEIRLEGGTLPYLLLISLMVHELVV